MYLTKTIFPSLSPSFSFSLSLLSPSFNLPSNYHIYPSPHPLFANTSKTHFPPHSISISPQTHSRSPSSYSYSSHIPFHCQHVYPHYKYSNILYNVLYNVLYSILYNVPYNILYNILYNVLYNILYNVLYNILYNVVYIVESTM